MKLFKKISLLCICLLLGASCILIGCGGRDKNTIRLNEVTRSIFYAPLYTALNLGYFEDEGIKVEIESNDGSDSSMSVLLSGNCEVALIGPEQVIYAKETSDHPVVFGQLTQRDGSFIVSKTKIDNFTLDMLKGKTIIGGRYGGLPAMTLEFLLKEKGYTIGTNKEAGEINVRTDIEFADIAAEFQKTSDEFCTLFEPNATRLQANSKNAFVLDGVGKYSGEVPYTCFVARQSYLKKNPEIAEKFLKAVKRGYDYVMNQEISLVADSIQKSFIGTTKDELMTAVTRYKEVLAWSESLQLSETAFNRLVKIINSATGENYTPDYAQCVDNTFAKKIAE